ncbi:MAG: TonB-dependent receptor [Verrucomicrobiota bacterium]|nr:TonB-dependent receptor [Verrucomicrobiota bacterium]
MKSSPSHHSRLLLHLIPLAALLLLPLQSFAATLLGVVSNAGNGSFLEGAVVTLEGTNFRTVTDRSGRYQFSNLPAGNYKVNTEIVGFDNVPQDVAVGEGVTTKNLELPASEDIVNLETFIIEGDATSSLRALNLERAANNNVSILAADNFGQLTDKTIADAIRRVPGVNVEKDSAGHAGRYVTIRGMYSDFNSVAINGQKVVVSNFDGASRSVPLDVIPSTSADLIEVTKSTLPSDDADAIGGKINIRTGSAFDKKGLMLKASASAGYLSEADNLTGDNPQDKTRYDFSAAYSDYLNEAKTLGVYLNLSHASNPNLYSSISNGLYEFDSVYLPTYARQEEAFDNVTSSSISTRLDYRPSDSFESSAEFNFTRRGTNQGSWRNDLFLEYGVDWDNLVAQNDTAVAFTAEDYAQKEVRDYYETQDNYNFILKNKHRFDALTIDYFGGLNIGKFEGDPNKDLRAYFTDTRELENGYSQVGRAANEPLYGNRIHAAANSDYEITEIRRDTRFIDDQTYAGGLNAAYEFDMGGNPSTLQSGFKATISDRDFDDLRRRYKTADVDWNLDRVKVGGQEVYGSVLADYGVDSALNGQPFGSLIDPDKVRAVEAVLQSLGIRDEGDANWYLNQNAKRDARADKVNSYDLEEKIYAGYLMDTTKFGDLTATVGVRVEATSVDIDTYSGDFYETDTTNPLYIRPISRSNDYTDLFPHLHLRYDLSKATAIRLSLNQTTARPSYRQLNPSEDIDPTFEDTDRKEDYGKGLVLKGDTNLNPVISRNIDLSMEQLIGTGVRLTGGVFYKNMDDNIYRLSRSVQPGDPSYYPSTAEVREYLNAKGAEVYGAELSADVSLGQFADFLQGVGISANYTYTESAVKGIQRYDGTGLVSVNDGTSLFGQVPHTVNLSLNYNRGGFETRLALHYTAAYLDFNGVNTDKNLDRYLDDRSTVDWSIFYDITPSWQVFGKVSNVLDSRTRAYYGDGIRLNYNEASGRTFIVGVNWNL